MYQGMGFRSDKAHLVAIQASCSSYLGIAEGCCPLLTIGVQMHVLAQELGNDVASNSYANVL